MLKIFEIYIKYKKSFQAEANAVKDREGNMIAYVTWYLFDKGAIFENLYTTISQGWAVVQFTRRFMAENLRQGK